MTPKDFETAVDFTFSIDKDESEIKNVAQKSKHIVVNNEQLESYVKLIKKDLKTDKTVTLNSASFKIKATKDIYDRGNGKILYKNGETVTQKVGKTTYDTFTTNSQNLVVPNNSCASEFDFLGTVITPLKLPVGSFEVYEISIPEGFLQLDEPVKFNIEGIRDFDKDEDGDPVIEVIVKNEQPTGTLVIDKSIALRENVDTSLIDTSDLSGIEFSLKANEDIIDYSDGSIIYKKGELVNNYNLSQSGNLTVSKIPMGRYILKEEKTLDGLVLNDTIYNIEFIKEDDITKVYTVTKDIINDTTLVDISKTDITGDEELVGAELKVIDENDNVIDSWTSTDKSHKIEGLKVEKSYKLVEDLAPLGFVKATSIDFKIEKTNSVQQVTMVDKVVEMSKTDVGGTEIEGATIQVLDDESNIIDEWVSTKESHKIRNLIEGKSYILHEEIVVDGYVKATDIPFKVTENKETQKLTMIDKVVEVSKRDVAGEEVEGAKLQVLDKDNNVIDEWISSKEDHKVSGLKEGDTYKLHEEVAIGDYVKASDIEFKVSFEKETQKIIMIDKLVEIIKTDLVTGEEIEGAELQVVDENDTIIDEWISTKEPHKVSGLEENKTYRLIEKTCPYGYEIAEEIEFTVTNEKVNQKIEMKDKPILKKIKLVKLDSDTKEVIKADFTFGIFEDEECTKLIKEVNSDKELGTITFEDLRYNTYFIKELKQPENYQLSDRIVKIEINENGTFADGVLLEDNDSVCSFEFYNQLVPKVQTGNETNYTLLIVSAIISLLEIIAGIFILRKNKKNN